MAQSCAVGKIEANLWLLWVGTPLPFTAWQWGAKLQAKTDVNALMKASGVPNRGHMKIAVRGHFNG